jgi:transcriptional regulator with XRE-family HTH domain
MSKRTRTMGDLYVYIGSRIKEARYDYRRIVTEAKKVMTQTELAKVCGVTFQQIQKYEKATNKVPLDNLLLIAEATRKDLLYFLPTNNERKEDVQSERTITEDTNTNDTRQGSNENDEASC